MKTPICSFDAKTGSLCSNCESKLALGHITTDDVEASMILTKLAEKNSEINKLTLSGAKKFGGEYILSLKGIDIMYLRSHPDVLKTIEMGFKNPVWLVESDSTDRRFIENLFYPLKITNLNLIWLPDGTKITKVVIGKSIHKDNKIEKIKTITKEIRNIDLIAEVE